MCVNPENCGSGVAFSKRMPYDKGNKSEEVMDMAEELRLTQLTAAAG